MDVLSRHAVQVAGDPASPPILFAHGFGCDQTLWRFVAPELAKDHFVVTFDYVGAGRSDRSAYDPGRYASLDGFAEDILDIVHRLDLRDVTLVGHSVSATIAMLASIAEPGRFRDLVLVTPSPRYLDDLPDYRGGFARADIEGLLGMMEVNATGWAAYLAPVVMGNPDRPELASDLEATFCTIDPVMARQFAEVTFLADNRADISKVSVPSLIIQVSDDVVAPIEVGRYLHQRLLDSTFRVIEGTGHCPHVSHPSETVGLIREYLRDRRPTPTPPTSAPAIA
ncbi:MAG TPA: alpha/beta hydrolase [Candidatus Limnocylindria bacterium]|nr:alpha/beta hydrolase [Candidatus Limnocylindria bacterium]